MYKLGLIYRVCTARDLISAGTSLFCSVTKQICINTVTNYLCEVVILLVFLNLVVVLNQVFTTENIIVKYALNIVLIVHC